jgi:two-component system sensor histidine kinase CreC
VKIRTAIFGVYASASAVGFAGLMAFVLHDVRLRYVESMRRTMGDTAAFLAVFVAQDGASDQAWPQKLAALPSNVELLRVFACERDGRVSFDSAGGRDLGQTYAWPMRGGGPAASENYTVSNVAEVGGELRVAAPVRRRGELAGWVGVGRPLATVAAGVRAARWRLLWSAGAIGLGMVAAGWWIASRLTNSLERLTDYALTVRDGKPAVPPVSRANEIAALARAFEEMRVALEGKAYVERYTQALAHELKAPLSSIRGAAELLGEDMPGVDRARFIANVRAEAERMQRIVDRLLELSALEARNGRVNFTVVDLRAIMEECAALARSAGEPRGIALNVTAPAPVRVRGEHFLLVQSLGNLLHNALEFTPRGGAVTVTITVDGAQATVSVEDTGPGVPPYALEKVFDRFYSLPRPDTGRKSSGLGLSIVREVARLHGGEVMLENRPGGGARAVLTLPVA